MLLTHVLPQSVKLFDEVLRLSQLSGDALQVPDLLYIGAGYLFIFAIIFSLNELFQRLLALRVIPTALAQAVLALTTAANMIKVGLLLFMRVFVLPICLGMVILYCCNMILAYRGDMWAFFAASNITGAVALAWVFGISYMVTTTLSVLQLREILHPQLLAKAIRPQEPHLDLLISLMTESSFTHLRRICASMLVYLFLLLLFAFIPAFCLRQTYNYFYLDKATILESHTSSSDYQTWTLSYFNNLINIFHQTVIAPYTNSNNNNSTNFTFHVMNTTNPTLSSLNNTTTATSSFSSNTSSSSHTEQGPPMYLSYYIKLCFCYYIPQIQVPAELAFAHLSFLTFLDKRKNMIGACQHSWLVFMCGILGVYRIIVLLVSTLYIICMYICMCHMIVKGLSRFLLPHSMKRDMNNINIDTGNDDDINVLRDAQGQPIVGPPLKRPPANWDSRTNRSTVSENHLGYIILCYSLCIHLCVFHSAFSFACSLRHAGRGAKKRDQPSKHWLHRGRRLLGGFSASWCCCFLHGVLSRLLFFHLLSYL